MATVMAGCLPMLSHDTRVSPGPSLAMHVGVQSGSRQRDPEKPTPPNVPGVGFQLSYGVRSSDSTAPAGRLAAGVGLFSFAPNADAYVQIASGVTGGFDAGVGVGAQFGSLPAVLPYFQVGRDLRGLVAWFTSHHIGWLRTGNGRRWSPVWLPTLAIVRRGDFGRGSAHAFVTGIVGSRGPDCAPDPCRAGRSRSERTFLIVGFSAEAPLPMSGLPYRYPTRNSSRARP